MVRLTGLTLALAMPVFLASGFMATGAMAGRYAAVPTVVALPQAPEGIGCYFERGRTFCSRYCYLEVDGHRFCRERTHEARSQAPLEDLPPMILTPMK